MDEISPHTAYQKSSRLDLLLLMLVLLALLLCVCVCFNLLSDNESNTVRVIWYFVMLYNCLVSFQT